MIEETIPRCTLCNHRLYQKKCGHVCKNWKCVLYWKLGGWCLKENSVWQYADPIADKENAWSIAHGYPPYKRIQKRHIEGMREAIHKNEELCFVIPLRYCFEIDGSGVIALLSLDDVMGGGVQ